MSGLPSPLTLNRVIANQRRALSQQQKVRPGKVPFRDPKEEDQFYNNQNQKSPRPQTSTRIVSSQNNSLQLLVLITSQFSGWANSKGSAPDYSQQRKVERT